MRTEKIERKRWSEEEMSLLNTCREMTPKEAAMFFPDRTYKSVKSMMYEHYRRHDPDRQVHNYTSRAQLNAIIGLNKDERFRYEYKLLPKGELESQDLYPVEVPKVIDFDLYSMRFGFPLSDEVIHNKAA